MRTRNTVQQRIIAEQLALLGNHPTVDEVYRAVSCERPTVSKATVYRALNKMADAGEVTRVNAGAGPERFDHRTDAHCHVRCVACGRVDDVSAGAFHDGVDQGAAANASGYEILGHELVFEGICPACQRGRERGELHGQ